MRYLIRKGDSLSLIAKHHFLTVTAILAVNPQITNPNLIKVGQIINLPCESHFVMAAEPGAYAITGSTATLVLLEPAGDLFVIDRFTRNTTDSQQRLMTS